MRKFRDGKSASDALKASGSERDIGTRGSCTIDGKHICSDYTPGGRTFVAIESGRRAGLSADSSEIP